MSALAELVALLVPPSCAVCGTRVPTAERLCVACWGALPWLPERGCPRCALPSHRGRPCPAARASFDSAQAAMVYEGPARALVHELKFRAALPLATLMAAHMAGALTVPAGATLVPVPPAPRRRRSRGFDPAGVLAAALGERLGLAVAAAALRREEAPRQVGAGRRLRRDPARLGVHATGGAGGRLVIVDDVHTTGATLEACALALRAAGAAGIHAISYARTL